MAAWCQPIEKALRSNVVYKFTCSSCKACYVGATARHLQYKKKGPVYKHLQLCNVKGEERDMEILCATKKGEVHLLTLEAYG